MAQTKLILASSSPRRRELLQMVNLPVEVVSSDADESVDESWPPEKIVEQLSLRKADAVRKRLSQGWDGLIIGSDTIVVLDGEVFGKPADENEAKAMLARLQGRDHQVYSGLAVIRTGTNRDSPERFGQEIHKTVPFGRTGLYRIVAETADGKPEIIVGSIANKVTFRAMEDNEIEAYVSTGEPMDKAGAYGVQGVGAVFIERIEGDFYSVMGLPINLLYHMLTRFGISPISFGWQSFDKKEDAMPKS